MLINRHFTLIVSFPEAPCFALYRSAQQSLFGQQWQILGAESSSLSLRHHSCPSPPSTLSSPLPIKKTACCDLSFTMKASVSFSLPLSFLVDILVMVKSLNDKTQWRQILLALIDYYLINNDLLYIVYSVSANLKTCCAVSWDTAWSPKPNHKWKSSQLAVRLSSWLTQYLGRSAWI